ncbi:MAG: PEP-CTERM sorting domain-containing protein [Opitutales bacterium]
MTDYATLLVFGSADHYPNPDPPMTRYPCYLISLLALAGLLAVGPLQANILFEESFDYTAGSDLENVSSWTNEGSSTTVNASSLSYGNLLTSGGSADATGGGGSLNHRLDIADIDFANRETWLSFLYQPDTTSQQNNGLYFRGTPTTGAGNYLMLFGFPDDPNQYGFKRFLGAGSASRKNPTPISAGGSTALLVAHFDFTQSATEGLITFYLNPDPDSLGVGSTPNGSEFTATIGNLSTTTEDEIEPFLLSELEVDALADGALFDELRIGDTWADVSPIPEPASLAMLVGLSGLGLAWRRRRTGRIRSPTRRSGREPGIRS